MAAPVVHVAKLGFVNPIKNVSRMAFLARYNVRSLSSVTNHHSKILNQPKSLVDQHWLAFQRPHSRLYSEQVENSTKEQIDSETQEISEAEKKLKEENAKLLEQIKELEDKYKRSLAETENVRLRMKKQIDDSKLFAIQAFCKDLLDVADVLEKATASVPKEELEKNNPHLKSLYDGLVMTDKELQGVFKRNGLEKIDPVDQKFDPNFHEAIFYQPFPGKTPGHVAVVTKIGYKLHSRTIRPAIVGVVKEG